MREFQKHLLQISAAEVTGELEDLPVAGRP
jgi:hypothetical protein